MNSRRFESLDEYMERCRDEDRTPDSHILCFGDQFADVRVNGMRAEFNYYAERHQSRVFRESIFFGFYRKVLYERLTSNLIIYTQDEVFCWDPRIKSILWSVMNQQYGFDIPWQDSKSHWRQYMCDAIYGVLVAHGLRVLDMGRYLGLSAHHAYMITRGATDISVRRLYLLGERFGMSIEELLWS